MPRPKDVDRYDWGWDDDRCAICQDRDDETVLRTVYYPIDLRDVTDQDRGTKWRLCKICANKVFNLKFRRECNISDAIMACKTQGSLRSWKRKLRLANGAVRGSNQFNEIFYQLKLAYESPVGKIFHESMVEKRGFKMESWYKYVKHRDSFLGLDKDELRTKLEVLGDKTFEDWVYECYTIP